MSARDLPHDRSLDEDHESRAVPDRAAPDRAATDRAVPDRAVPDSGAARSPAELLDNLRLRLSQLPENHPSAVRDPAPERDRRKDRLADRPVDDAIERSEASAEGGGEQVAEPEAGADDPGSDDPRGADRGSFADLIRAIKEAGDEASLSGADLSAFGEFGLFAGSGGADPYRPWFMDGEPGTPWFAEDF
jgi:hypothetical protein